jgi:hypothetical protein
MFAAGEDRGGGSIPIDPYLPRESLGKLPMAVAIAGRTSLAILSSYYRQPKVDGAQTDGSSILVAKDLLTSRESEFQAQR